LNRIVMTFALAVLASLGYGALGPPRAAAAVEDDLRDGDKF